jgi:hypothetical protein
MKLPVESWVTSYQNLPFLLVYVWSARSKWVVPEVNSYLAVKKSAGWAGGIIWTAETFLGTASGCSSYSCGMTFYDRSLLHKTRKSNWKMSFEEGGSKEINVLRFNIERRQLKMSDWDCPLVPVIFQFMDMFSMWNQEELIPGNFLEKPQNSVKQLKN